MARTGPVTGPALHTTFAVAGPLRGYPRTWGMRELITTLTPQPSKRAMVFLLKGWGLT